MSLIKKAFRLVILLFSSLLLTRGAIAIDLRPEIIYSGDILIKEGRRSEVLPYLHVKRLSKVTFLLVGKARFANGRKKIVVKSTTGKFALPSLRASQPFDESRLLIRSKRKDITPSVRVYTHPRRLYPQLLASRDMFGSFASILKNDFAIVDLKGFAKSKEMLDGAGSRGTESFSPIPRSLPSDKDIGSESFSSDFGTSPPTSAPTTKSLCIRSWIPGTPLGSGRITWLNNPGRIGFSFKEERVDTGFVRDLRCPAGPYRTDNYVDGIYRLNWAFIAYKVPDHCSARRVRENGVSGFRCCCNSFLTSRGYGICQFVNTYDSEFGVWPKAPRSTCG